MKRKIVLVLTGAVCSLLLYLVYGVTNHRIESEITHKLDVCLIEIMFPWAKEYKVSDKDTTLWIANDTTGKIMGIVSFKSVIPDTVWSVFDTAGNKIGIVFKVFPRGYGGPIETFVGLNMDSTITGIRTATPAEGLKETPGLGTKINDAWFKRQFIGKREAKLLLKKEGGTIDAITAATISSKAVVDGVRKGIQKYKKYL